MTQMFLMRVILFRVDIIMKNASMDAFLSKSQRRFKIQYKQYSSNTYFCIPYTSIIKTECFKLTNST